MPRLCSSLLLSLLIASSASAVTMDWTPIGNPGNAGDSYPGTASCGVNHDQPCGAVPYAYSIGTYEVTNAQYAAFLNAKAVSDTLGLYNTNMADTGFQNRGGITRSGNAGSYSYSAIAGRENMSVNNVSFFDVLRFANWMNNGQGNGDTETGSYTLEAPLPLGVFGMPGVPSNWDTVTRNPGTTIVLPSQEEWFKAAYYDPESSSYFLYPAGSSAPITCTTPTAALNSANCLNAVGDLTSVGSYTSSPSPYGTFDQGGNVWEWNESFDGLDRRDAPAGYFRGMRGGGYEGFGDDSFSQATIRTYCGFNCELKDGGFRLAMIPEPGTGLLVIAGLLGLGGWRRATA